MSGVMKRMRKPRPIDIGPEQSINGSMLSAKNARALLTAASSSAGSGQYGIATALCVLAAEEGSKAFALWANSVDPETGADALPSMFFEHKAKHELAQVVTLMANFIFVLMEAKDTVQRDIDIGKVQMPSFV